MIRQTQLGFKLGITEDEITSRLHLAVYSEFFDGIWDTLKSYRQIWESCYKFINFDIFSLAFKRASIFNPLPMRTR